MPGGGIEHGDELAQAVLLGVRVVLHEPDELGVRRGPAPLNLEVPPYEFVTDTAVRIG